MRKTGIDQSGMYKVVVDLDDEYSAIAGAKVFLAFDEKGQQPVPGFETRSDEKGMYTIDTKDLPPAQRKHNGYFLIVEKEGYEPLRQEMGFGFMSPYLHNSVVLKPIVRRRTGR
jgi:hypothetical protein